jgi:hypothetical protein
VRLDRGRISTATVVSVLCTFGPVACGPDTGERPAALGEGAATTTVPTIAEWFDLPFGLVQLTGTVPIGRPAVFEQVLYYDNGAPVRGTSLRAAYRVTDPDPVGVVRAMVERLDGLTLDEVSVRAAAESGAGPIERQPWIQADGYADDPDDRDFVGLQLWVTGELPILLVSVDRASALPPRAPTVSDEAGRPSAPRSVVDDRQRTAGDELFEEQGDEIHLPRGTWSLMPTLPTFGGTGGSTSVIAAEDAEAAVRALLDEARGLNGSGEVTEPKVTETNGTRIIEAGFVITAGGWGFDVVAVRAPQDPYATVYVTSGAD